MKIVFLEQGGSYVAEFQVDSAFALHLEGVREDQVTLYQRSGDSSRYDTIIDFRRRPVYDDVMDYESDVLVSPKYIMIVSDVLPTYAEVISDGEVTEIKSHSKEVEIVANGTTEVTPDAGYSYLSGVKVKVNVPQEGGGGGSWEYWDLTGISGDMKVNLVQLAGLLLKAPSLGAICGSMHGFSSSEVSDNVTAIGTIPSTKIYVQGVGLLAIADFIAAAQYTPTQITEEEFYNLETA